MGGQDHPLGHCRYPGNLHVLQEPSGTGDFLHCCWVLVLLCPLPWPVIGTCPGEAPTLNIFVKSSAEKRVKSCTFSTQPAITWWMSGLQWKILTAEMPWNSPFGGSQTLRRLVQKKSLTDSLPRRSGPMLTSFGLTTTLTKKHFRLPSGKWATVWTWRQSLWSGRWDPPLLSGTCCVNDQIFHLQSSSGARRCRRWMREVTFL